MSHVFVVQTFREDQSGLATDFPHRFTRQKDALAIAKRLSSVKAGVVVFTALADAASATGMVSVLYSAGRMPERWRSRFVEHGGLAT